MNTVYRVYGICEMNVIDEGRARSRYVDQLIHEASFFSQSIAMDYVRQALRVNETHQYTILPVFEIVKDLQGLVIDSVKAAIALCGYDPNSYIFCLSAPDFYLHVEQISKGELKPQRIKLVIMPQPLKSPLDTKGHFAIKDCCDAIKGLLGSEMDVACLQVYSKPIFEYSVTIR